LLNTHLHIVTTLFRRTSGRNLGNFRQRNAVAISGNNEQTSTIALFTGFTKAGIHRHLVLEPPGIDFGPIGGRFVLGKVAPGHISFPSSSDFSKNNNATLPLTQCIASAPHAPQKAPKTPHHPTEVDLK